MPDNITPEEKLLNLIKGSKGSEEKKKGEVPSDAKEAPKAGETPKAKEAPKAEEAPKAKEEVEAKTKEHVPAVIRKRKKELGNPFPILNKFLFLIMSGVLVYMVVGYIFPYKSKTDISERIEGREALKSAKEDLVVLPPLSNYTTAVRRRKMFKVYEPPKPKTVGPTKPKVTLQQLLGGYTFVGIIGGDPPQAVVEEKRSKQSYYLSAGQYLGEIKIDKVQKGKVTVSYGDETMDIRI